MEQQKKTFTSQELYVEYIEKILKSFKKSEIIEWVTDEFDIEIPSLNRKSIKEIAQELSYNFDNLYLLLNSMRIDKVRRIAEDFNIGKSRYKADLIWWIIDDITKIERISHDNIISFFLSHFPIYFSIQVFNKNNEQSKPTKTESINKLVEIYGNDFTRFLFDFTVDDLKKFCRYTILADDGIKKTRLSTTGLKRELVYRLHDHYYNLFIINKIDSTNDVIEEISEEEIKENEAEEVKIPENENEKYLKLLEKRDEFEKINYELLERIINDLENGVKPWKKSWTNYGVPMNFVTKKEYTLGNIMYLIPYINKYKSPYFATQKQIEKAGGSVLPDEKPVQIAFRRTVKKNVKTVEEEIKDKSLVIEQSELFEHDNEKDKENEKTKEYEYHYYYIFAVYNINQTSGLDKLKQKLMDQEPNYNIIEVLCENIVSKMPDPPDIKFQLVDNDPSYNFVFDYIIMPERKQFKNPSLYWSTLFHELSHSTGHDKRLKRRYGKVFGDSDYAQEELVAELSASLLCSHCHLTNETITNNTSYLGNWLQSLKENPYYLISKLFLAQQSANYILGKIKKEDKKK